MQTSIRSGGLRRAGPVRPAVLVALTLGPVLALAVGPGAAAQDGEKPTIKITRPAIQSPHDLVRIAGKAGGPDRAACKVVVYAQTDKWYVQPYANSYLTDINSDGTWEADTHLGQKYAALLVRPSYKAPTTLAALPEVSGDVLAIHQVSARPEVTEKGEGRVLQFSGYEWKVKSSDGRVGPGPNYFSDSEDDVFVDDQGRLHLRIARRDGRWTCSEVILEKSFGYGTYRFSLGSNVDGLDPNIVLGLFTWNDAPAYHHREIDIEISRWRDVNNENAQFVVQPYTRRRNIARFRMPTGLAASTHSFTWNEGSVTCRSVAGRAPGSPGAEDVLHEHTFTQDIPKAGGENARINLWLFGGKPPLDGKPAELIICKFEFAP